MADTYANPVYPGYFADPHITHAQDRWWAVGTGAGQDAPIGLVSDDLVRWEPWQPFDHAEVLAAVAPATTIWAPEIARIDDRYHLYFSAGVADTGHVIHVAEADEVAGPYTHVRPVRGIDEPFAIDAHVWTGAGGNYLFHCADRIDGPRPGTNIVVRELAAPDEVLGAEAIVVAPSADWQLYERRRSIHGRVLDWHTCEGPFVVASEDRLWCLYSGGNWTTPGYGMAAVWANHPMGPWHAPESPGPTVLATAPGRVHGPGHASVIKDLADQHWLVYHAWDPAGTARRMRLDPLGWHPEPVCDGPSTTPRPAPVAVPSSDRSEQ